MVVVRECVDPDFGEAQLVEKLGEGHKIISDRLRGGVGHVILGDP